MDFMKTMYDEYYNPSNDYFNTGKQRTPEKDWLFETIVFLYIHEPVVIRCDEKSRYNCFIKYCNSYFNNNNPKRDNYYVNRLIDDNDLGSLIPETYKNRKPGGPSPNPPQPTNITENGGMIQYTLIPNYTYVMDFIYKINEFITDYATFKNMKESSSSGGSKRKTQMGGRWRRKTRARSKVKNPFLSIKGKKQDGSEEDNRICFLARRTGTPVFRDKISVTTPIFVREPTLSGFNWRRQ